MTLREIRKHYKVSRKTIAEGLNCTQMVVRRIEDLRLPDLTFGHIEIYADALGVTQDHILSTLFGIDITEARLKSVFWEFTATNKINIRETYNSLINCSNKCSLLTLHNYANDTDIFKNIKLNWSYFKLTGCELMDLASMF